MDEEAYDALQAAIAIGRMSGLVGNQFIGKCDAMEEDAMKYLCENDLKVLDAIRSAIDNVALPSFWVEDHVESKEISDNEMLRKIGEKRAYSAAQAKLVEAMIKSGAFERAFEAFVIPRVIKLNRNEVIEKYWPEIRTIRFKFKVDEILEASKVIAAIGHEFGSFTKYVENIGKPRKIKRPEDIECFWKEFDRLISDLRNRGLPIISNEITLLHFLETDLQLDCLKPDIVVMRVLSNTGLVPAKGKSRHRGAVSKIQEYYLLRKIRPQMMDRYLLAFGGQTRAKDVVTMSYCRSIGRCESPTCPLGESGLCPTWTSLCSAGNAL